MRTNEQPKTIQKKIPGGDSIEPDWMNNPVLRAQWEEWEKIEAEQYRKGLEDGIDEKGPYLNTLEGRLYIPPNGWIATGAKIPSPSETSVVFAGADILPISGISLVAAANPGKPIDAINSISRNFAAIFIVTSSAFLHFGSRVSPSSFCMLRYKPFLTFCETSAS